MQQLPRSTLDEVIESNKYLMLPRISSKKFFDELCPEEYKAKNRKYVESVGVLLAPFIELHTCEPRHEIPNNVVCATSKGSDQPAHTHSLIRAFASRLIIL